VIQKGAQTQKIRDRYGLTAVSSVLLGNSAIMMSHIILEEAASIYVNSVTKTLNLLVFSYRIMMFSD